MLLTLGAHAMEPTVLVVSGPAASLRGVLSAHEPLAACVAAAEPHVAFLFPAVLTVLHMANAAALVGLSNEYLRLLLQRCGLLSANERRQIWLLVVVRGLGHALLTLPEPSVSICLNQRRAFCHIADFSRFARFRRAALHNFF